MTLGWMPLPGRAVMLVLCFTLVVVQLASATEYDPFQERWMRTDLPVREAVVDRSWIWGPQSNAYRTTEPYAEAPGGQRAVIYFDKARMEVTDPDRDREDPWFVTNGLLVVELVTGRMQVGDASFEQRGPAAVNLAGDPDDPSAVTYATFAALLAPSTGDQPRVLTQTIDRSGAVGSDARLAEYGVGTAYYVPETGHWIATPFWEFMNSSGLVWTAAGYVTEPLFESPFYATGLPITEAYWTRVRVAGVAMDVLVQCFERRCLTYTPGNRPGWEVEMGNVGLHYYLWRYGAPPPKPVG